MKYFALIGTFRSVDRSFNLSFDELKLFNLASVNGVDNLRDFGRTFVQTHNDDDRERRELSTIINYHVPKHDNSSWSCQRFFPPRSMSIAR